MAMSSSIDPSALPALPRLARPGSVIAGKYRIQGMLGAGGMGVVVSAMHLQLDQRVAIKFMSPLNLLIPDGVARFMAEARIAARIQCEHVVRVFDVASLEDGTPYIVMEHLEGDDLAGELRRVGPFRVSDAIDCVLQASEAIAEAHAAGVVHRDLKPGNLFACRRPDQSTMIKVLDFGVSKLLRKSDALQVQLVSTAPNVIMGSPVYCSPEQIVASKSVDARADIWALGAILHELLSGRPPFRGGTLIEVIHNVMNVPVEPLATLRSDVPPELDAAIGRCLAKAPADRFPSTAELARALVPFAPRRSLLSIDRIDGVLRRATRSTGAAAGPPSSAPALVSPPCEKTLPSRPEPSPPGSSSLTRRLSWFKRWATPIGVAAFAGAFGATAALLTHDRSYTAGPRSVTATSAATAEKIATATPAAAPPDTASAASSAPGAEPSVLAPLTESASTPDASTGRPMGTRAAPRHGRRNPDTSEFGGLQ
jgi:serine/threonine-protein kinase